MSPGINDIPGGPSVEPPQYTNGSVPWTGPRWQHADGWTSPSSEATPDRYLSAPATLLGAVLPVVYGTARAPGQCFLLKMTGTGTRALIGFAFSHGKQDSITQVEINGQTTSEIQALPDAGGDWLLNVYTFLGDDDGINATDYGPARTMLNALGIYHSYPGIAGVILHVALGSTNLPGSFQVTATLTGRLCVPLAGGAKAVTTNPFVILKDIQTEPEAWRGLSSDVVSATDWGWLEDEADEEVFVDGVKRWEYNGIVGMRNPDEAAADVLAHTCTSMGHLNRRCYPIADWKPRPITGTWEASASDTILGTGGNALAELSAGDRIYVDGCDYTDGYLTVLSVDDDDTIVVSQTVTIAAVNAGNRVRPITGVSVTAEEWVKHPEGGDVPESTIPDVVVVNYHTIGKVDQLQARAEDPDGYVAADVRRVELTLSGCAYPGQAERMGHVIRRTSAYCPFSWQGIAAPTCGIADLLPGDVFTFETRDGLVGQAAILMNSTINPDGSYTIGFREYDFNAYEDDATTDDDAPLDLGDFTTLPTPDLPTAADATIFRRGPWSARTKVSPTIKASAGWAVTNASLTTVSTPDAEARGIFAPTSSVSDAILTSPTFSLGVPAPTELLVSFRMWMNQTPDPATWDSSVTIALEYWSGTGAADTLRKTKDITIKEDVTNQYLVSKLFTAAAGDTHAFKVRVVGGSAKIAYVLALWNFYVIGHGSILDGAIVMQVDITEAAGAADTVDYYEVLAVDQSGRNMTRIGTIEQGQTSGIFYLITGGGRMPHPLGSEFMNRYKLGARGRAGRALMDFDGNGIVDIIDKGVASDYTEGVIDHTAADWDDSNRAAGKLAVVGSDDVTKEYQTPTEAGIAETDTDESFSALDVGDVGGGNYVHIDEVDGIKLVGTATTWDDLQVASMSVQLQGGADPAFAKYDDDGSGSTGLYLYKFSASAVNEVFFTAQLPHRYKAGTDIKFHVHWLPDTTEARTSVVWRLEYKWVSIDDVAAANTTVVDYEHDGAAAGFTTDKHTISGVATITGTGKGESSMLVCRLARVGNTALDDYAGGAWFLGCDFHYQIEKLGTKDEYPGA